MQPGFNNSMPPPHISQFQSNPNPAFNAQQAFAMQNSMPIRMLMQQPVPQMGMMNPQMSTMLPNYNSHLNNRQQTQPNNMAPFMMHQQQQKYQHQQQVGFTPNHTGMIPQMGFNPQNQFNNMNNVPMFMNNQVGPGQPPQGQGFGRPNFNSLQQINQNMGFPNLQNPMQNFNPRMPVQMPNPSQVGSFNVPMNGNQALGPKSNFHVNGMFNTGNQVNPNQQNFRMPMMGANAMKTLPVATKPAQGSLSSIQQLPLVGRQGDLVQKGQNGTSSYSGKNLPRKCFKYGSKLVGSGSRYQKSQFHPMNNRKRKFVCSEEHNRKGTHQKKAAKFDHATPAAPVGKKRRSLASFYTAKEVQIWREQRRKNWPTKANIQKKLKEKANPQIANREVEDRCKELNEVLAKQAALGFELPEIPRCYLSNSDIQVHGKGRLCSKNNKRGGKFGKNKTAKFGKKFPPAKKDVSSAIKREPTLLQKLFSKDIRRDRLRLLQVLRFMVLNSFFKDWPEKPLQFPAVEANESWPEKEEVDSDEANDRTTNEVSDDGSDTDEEDDSSDSSSSSSNSDDTSNNDGDEHVAQEKQGTRQDGIVVEEEEGEIKE